MKKNRSVPDATVIPVLTYADVREAVGWLIEAFGFKERVRIGRFNWGRRGSQGRGAVAPRATG